MSIANHFIWILLPAFFFLSSAANVQTADAQQPDDGELLYNGIRLPEQWPPRRTVAGLRKHEPMAVPWLNDPPEIIPIDVGRQLFVDDFLIESTTLQRVFHKAEFYEGNPVIRPDRRWERGRGNVPSSAMAYSDGVFYDPQDKLFKMWYRFGIRGGFAYAVSEDGMKWEKPAIDHVQPGTNIVLLSGNRDSATVWLDHETTEPAQRFKLFQFHRDAWKSCVHTSPDGIHWNEPVWTGPTWDRSTIFYNPFRKVWIYSIRTHLYPGPWDYRSKPPKPIGRARKYWEHADFVAGAKWTGGQVYEDWKEDEPVWWCAADRLDSPEIGPDDTRAELYNLDAVAYESILLGLFSVWHGGSSGSRPKINDIMLGFSRDGFHWHRPFRQAVIPVADDIEAWNWANVQSVGGGCLVVRDRLFFYASGRNAKEDTTGLAFLRRDGFASMQADENEGALTTRLVRFGGRFLFVNAAIEDGGSLEIEILDSEGNVIPQFPRQDCDPIREDKTLIPVKWNEAEDLASIAGQPVRFRFHLKQGALYSFWASPNDKGASQGYVAAGGPKFTGPKDTVGIAAYED